MGMKGGESKVLIESSVAPKQSTVRSILVVLFQDKEWCAFFYLGWYWVWTGQFATDCGDF
jgi:hypothetical protein